MNDLLRPLFFCLALLYCSCSKEPKWTTSQLWNMSQKVEPNIELIIVTKQEKRVLCENYGMPKCIPGSGKRIKVRLVELVAIQFETTAAARNAAKAFGQYYSRDWMFDEVANEPVLESFIIKTFGAIKP